MLFNKNSLMFLKVIPQKQSLKSNPSKAIRILIWNQRK